ncbi:MAG: hypothetical protein J6Y02_04015 [Pseudobutyrivibrio sp.]|nr:hypothetical protein [Pseudobutyrivibrio sp.]
MFIELHRPKPITVSLACIEYFVPADNGGTAISVPNYNGWLKVIESYEEVQELVAMAVGDKHE